MSVIQKYSRFFKIICILIFRMSAPLKKEPKSDRSDPYGKIFDIIGMEQGRCTYLDYNTYVESIVRALT